MTIHSDNSTMEGYILLHREIFDHWIYDNGNYFKWWCKLLFLANYEDSKIIVGFTPTVIKRGQMRASISFLMEAFGCKNRNTIVKFLKLLEREKMIHRETIRKQTFITIINYDKYQSPWMLQNIGIKTDTNSDTNVDTDCDTNVDTQTNNINKEKEYYTPTTSKDVASPKGTKTKSQEEKERELDKRRNEFYNSLIPFVDTYGKVMIREFYNYWTEMNKSHTKMKFELCRTWETPRRLVTWSKNNDQWKK